MKTEIRGRCYRFHLIQGEEILRMDGEMSTGSDETNTTEDERRNV